MRRIIALVLAFTLLYTAAALAFEDVTIELTINDPVMTVNGEECEVDPGRGTAPVIVDGRTLIPVRAVVEAIGGTVGWEEETRTAILTYDGTEIRLTIDSVTAYLNGKRTLLDARPTVINERTCLPIRFVMESFGYAVSWDEAAQKITIAKESAMPTLDPRPLGKVTATAELSDGKIKTTGGTMVAEGSVLTITEGGTYKISGKLSDGQIVVNAPDDANVELVLDGVDITSNKNSAIYCMNAKNFYITLMPGTENVLTDAENYKYADEAEEEPNAALFSKVDLNIGGEGTLTVNGRFNNGIGTKDDLEFEGGTYKITAVDNGIRGRDSITVKAGSFEVTAGGDGFSSNNPNGPSDGWITMSFGTYKITAGGDAVQAESSLGIAGGSFDIVTTGTPTGSSDSQKALKAGTNLTVLGGVINIDSIDDAMNANENITISGGSIKVKTGKDAIQADMKLTVKGGKVDVASCGDGIKAATLEVTGGNINICAKDDVVSIQSEEAGAVVITGGSLAGIGGAEEIKLSETSTASLGVKFAEPIMAGTEVTVTAKGEEEPIYEGTAAVDVCFVQLTGDDITVGTTYVITAGERSFEVTVSENLTIAEE